MPKEDFKALHQHFPFGSRSFVIKCHHFFFFTSNGDCVIFGNLQAFFVANSFETSGKCLVALRVLTKNLFGNLIKGINKLVNVLKTDLALFLPSLKSMCSFLS